MRFTQLVATLATALALTITAAPMDPKDGLLAPREELYPVQYLGVKDDAEKRDEVEKREELYPIQYLGVKDDAE